MLSGPPSSLLLFLGIGSCWAASKHHNLQAVAPFKAVTAALQATPPPQNTNPNSSTLPRPPVPPRPTHLDWLPLELKLRLMEFSDPTDLITLWDRSESFKHALRSRHAVKTWNRMRRAAGKAFRSTRPIPQEFEVLRYALEEGCEVCNAREAPRQWHWGSRICAGCLPSKVVTRRQFLQEHGGLFKSLPGAVKKIHWFNPAEVPGLEYTQIAANSLDPVNFENPDDGAFRGWVDAAVKAVHDVMRAKPNGSQRSIATDVEGLISGERQWAETVSGVGFVDAEMARRLLTGMRA
ncbi:hypothetical protein FRC04_009571 [Tulasnella sp. 424]|nr:hypothetical protein FRC04_009571 [Tulasnella sp. 424]KAG8974254.1 hypothetical protein FRC05_007678 [Tulasnella sp. 425]